MDVADSLQSSALNAIKPACGLDHAVRVVHRSQHFIPATLRAGEFDARTAASVRQGSMVSLAATGSLRASVVTWVDEQKAQAMESTRIGIGNLDVQRIEESHGPGFPPQMMFPELPQDALERHRNWMVPHYYNPQLNAFVSSIHTWLVRTPHHTVLIDSCVGNHKDRPDFPRFNQLDVP
jgi:hypothetical protein